MLNFPLKRQGFQSPPPSIKRIQTDITTGFFICLCVCVCPSQTTDGLPSLPPPRPRKAMRKRDWEKKMASSTTAFGFWILVCGPKAIFTLSFPLLLVVHCTCTGEKEDERAQDSHAFQMGALVERFKRSDRLRDTASVLAFLSSNARFFFERLQRVNRSRVDHCKQWNTPPLSISRELLSLRIGLQLVSRNQAPRPVKLTKQLHVPRTRAHFKISVDIMPIVIFEHIAPSSCVRTK